ncbi:hypothetical protein EDD21DRAFT_121402 [Dissophora ornata]|nr:hypothetical protein EDD21DRAFT_121402 [Dissophora ornata]
MTPSHPFSTLPHPMSTAGEIFSPLTSPALQPHRSSQMDYLSFSGPNFSSLPLQFQQAHHTQQQQIQNQLQQLQSQTQSDSSQSSQQLQLQQQNQGVGTKHARVDTSSPALNSQRPPLKRRTTVERTSTTLASVIPRSAAGAGGGGPVRVALSKSSPAIRPLASNSPISPAALRKQPTNSNRIRPSSSALAPSSPLAIHFPGGNNNNVNIRPTPSPILTSTSQPMSSQAQSQASPSPHLISNMNHLSMMPASPAMFALPASSMMPPPRSPMILPSQHSQNPVQTPRQLSISQLPGQAQRPQQKGYQISIHQPIQPSQAPSTGSILKPVGSNGSNATNAAAMIKTTSATATVPAAAVANAVQGSESAVATSSSGSNTSTSTLAPVTPASLMNLSGSESTPTSSPKFTANGKTRALLTKPNNNKSSTSEKSGSKSNSSSSSSSKGRGGKRQSTSGMTTAGIIAPRTPGTGTPTMISPMPPPPPAGGFASLISPALKPTLMPQPSHHHRGSLSVQPILVSPRVQPMLVSPSLKPWLPGVSTTEVMARLASKSNYQNILDGDHTALGLSYNTDLHSGIELRRTSHKAAEQKRRDSLKHCFDDLRQMIPNIVDKAPSKVFLLKKSFDYICTLKSEMAQKDLHIARMEAQEQYFRQQLENWFETTSIPEGVVLKKPEMENWRMSEDKLGEVTRREMAVARIAAQLAEQSAVAVEVARQGNQPGGNKEGKGNNNNSSGKNGAANSGNHNNNSNKNNGKSASSRNRSSDDGDDSDNDEEGGPVTVSTTSGSASATTTTTTTTTTTASVANSSILPRSKEFGQPQQAVGNNARSDKDLSGDVYMSLPDEDEQGQSTQRTSSGVSGATSVATIELAKGARGRRARSRSTKSGQGEGEEEGEDDYEEEDEEDDDDEDDDDKDDDDEDEEEEDEDEEDFEDQEMTDATTSNGRPI